MSLTHSVYAYLLVLPVHCTYVYVLPTYHAAPDVSYWVNILRAIRSTWAISLSATRSPTSELRHRHSLRNRPHVLADSAHDCYYVTVIPSEYPRKAISRNFRMDLDFVIVMRACELPTVRRLCSWAVWTSVTDLDRELTKHTPSTRHAAFSSDLHGFAALRVI